MKGAENVQVCHYKIQMESIPPKIVHVHWFTVKTHYHQKVEIKPLQLQKYILITPPDTTTSVSLFHLPNSDLASLLRRKY